MNPDIESFKQRVLNYYNEHGRELPWRRAEADGNFDPYKILVSEMMLQQTQVKRVTPKYEEFLRQFPTVQTMAKASLGEVLKVWSGLGYNRRAKYLWQAAQAIVANHDGQVPHTRSELIALPGVGTNTAGAILAYAYNQPTIFIETNIRTVFIHHFFPIYQNVHDRSMFDILAATLDQENPRDFYWALMDYGSHLKATVGNAARSSKHYKPQSKFEGSKRQLRGQVVQLLINGTQSRQQLQSLVADIRLAAVLHDLQKEGLITQRENHYTLT